MIFEERIENEDDGPYVFLIDGKEVGRADYNSHGSQGMDSASFMFSNIAAHFGEEVVQTFGEC